MDRIDITNIVYDAPVEIEKGIYESYITDGPVTVKFPKLQVESLKDNKLILKLNKDKEKHKALISNLKELEEFTKDKITQNIDKWLGVSLTSDKVKTYFKSNINSDNSKILFNMDQNNLNPKDFVFPLATLIKFHGIIFTSRSCYFKFSIFKYKFVKPLFEPEIEENNNTVFDSSASQPVVLAPIEQIPIEQIPQKEEQSTSPVKEQKEEHLVEEKSVTFEEPEKMKDESEEETEELEEVGYKINEQVEVLENGQWTVARIMAIKHAPNNTFTYDVIFKNGSHTILVPSCNIRNVASPKKKQTMPTTIKHIKEQIQIALNNDELDKAVKLGKLLKQLT